MGSSVLRISAQKGLGSVPQALPSTREQREAGQSVKEIDLTGRQNDHQERLLDSHLQESIIWGLKTIPGSQVFHLHPIHRLAPTGTKYPQLEFSHSTWLLTIVRYL